MAGRITIYWEASQDRFATGQYRFRGDEPQAFILAFHTLNEATPFAGNFGTKDKMTVTRRIPSTGVIAR